MNPRGPAILLAATFLATALALWVLTFELNPLARLVPMAVAIPTVVLLALELARDLAPGINRMLTPYERLSLDKVERLKATRHAEPTGRGQPAGVVVAWFALAPLLIVLTGFVVATVVYSIAFLRYKARESWSRSAALGIAIALPVAILPLAATGRPLTDGPLLRWIFGG